MLHLPDNGLKIQCPSAEFPSRTVWSAAQELVARLVRDYRNRQAILQFERLDDSILRDIGITRSGMKAGVPEIQSREKAPSTTAPRKAFSMEVRATDTMTASLMAVPSASAAQRSWKVLPWRAMRSSSGAGASSSP